LLYALHSYVVLLKLLFCVTSSVNYPIIAFRHWLPRLFHLEYAIDIGGLLGERVRNNSDPIFGCDIPHLLSVMA
jgi:hypothetical protein